MICKYWNGTTHIDVGGNVIFLKKDDSSEITSILEDIIHDRNKYNIMKNVAEGKAMHEYSYMSISRKVTE